MVKVSGVPFTAPTLTQLRLTGATFSLSASTQAGLNYVLESADSLRGSDWSVRQTLAGDGTTLTFTDSPAAVRNRFYRLRVE